jgi:hypothetical protein
MRAAGMNFTGSVWTGNGKNDKQRSYTVRVLENKIERAVVRYALHKYGVESLKMTPQGSRGYPDRIFLFPQWPLWLEFKRLGEEPKKLQYKRIEQLEELSYEVYWTNDEKDGKYLIDYYAKLTQVKPRRS